LHYQLHHKCLIRPSPTCSCLTPSPDLFGPRLRPARLLSRSGSRPWPAAEDPHRASRLPSAWPRWRQRPVLAADLPADVEMPAGRGGRAAAL
jgi:hypothetical protein